MSYEFVESAQKRKLCVIWGFGVWPELHAVGGGGLELMNTLLRNQVTSRHIPGTSACDRYLNSPRQSLVAWATVVGTMCG